MTMLSLILAATIIATTPVVRASPTDCDVFAATLREFRAHASRLGPANGFGTLRYIVSDRSHRLSEKFEGMVTNSYFPHADEMRRTLRQYVFRDLADRASGRTPIGDCSLPEGFSFGEDRFLPTTTLFENKGFEKRFAPAEGVIYLTMPGYSAEYSSAVVVAEMYFSLWETSTLYTLSRESPSGWRVVGKHVFYEQGE